LNRLFRQVGSVSGLFACSCLASFGQAAPVPSPDVLLLVDGEKLIGHLESADASQVVFKSEIAGEVKVDWSKVQDLQSSAKFALAKKGVTFGRHTDPSTVPQGTLAVADQKVTITPGSGASQVVPVADTQNVIPQASFLSAFEHPKLTDFWTGAASAGFALVQSTQKSKTLTSALSLIRTVPSEGWIAPRYRTTFDFDSAYGDNTSNGVTVKTNIIHAGLEQDEYITPRLFGFGEAAFDHNYSQGLDLQYTLGLGLGFVAYKDAHQELDLKGQVAYIDQIFTVGKETHLIGAVFGETYNRSFQHGVVLHQELSVTPTFNAFSDYSANFLSNVGFPISKTFDVTFGINDSFLNNPPPGFQKNSFQFITNLTYKIK
jgi:hypothetical protein